MERWCHQVGLQIADKIGPSEPAPLKQRPDAEGVERLSPREQHRHEGWILLGCRIDNTTVGILDLLTLLASWGACA